MVKIIKQIILIVTVNNATLQHVDLNCFFKQNYMKQFNAYGHG